MRKREYYNSSSSSSLSFLSFSFYLSSTIDLDDDDVIFLHVISRHGHGWIENRTRNFLFFFLDQSFLLISRDSLCFAWIILHQFLILSFDLRSILKRNNHHYRLTTSLETCTLIGRTLLLFLDIHVENVKDKDSKTID